MSGLVHEEEFFFRRFSKCVERSPKHGRVWSRLNQTRNDDDHQFAFLTLVALGREQGAQYWHISKPRCLPNIIGIIILQQARDGKGLSVM